jgi:hypothetical protein
LVDNEYVIVALIRLHCVDDEEEEDIGCLRDHACWG